MRGGAGGGHCCGVNDSPPGTNESPQSPRSLPRVPGRTTRSGRYTSAGTPCRRTQHRLSPDKGIYWAIMVSEESQPRELEQYSNLNNNDSVTGCISR